MLTKRQPEPPAKEATPYPHDRDQYNAYVARYGLPVIYRIPLAPRGYAIVDADDYEWLSRYYWRLVKSGNCFYAVRRYVRSGKAFTIRMHREIMHTPADLQCHHKNLNSLDDRKENLENLTDAQHRAAHGKV